MYVLLLVVVFISKYDYNFFSGVEKISATKKVEISNSKVKAALTKSEISEKDNTLLDNNEYEIDIDGLAPNLFYFDNFKSSIGISQNVVSNFNSKNLAWQKQPFYILFCNLKVDLA